MSWIEQLSASWYSLQGKPKEPDRSELTEEQIKAVRDHKLCLKCTKGAGFFVTPWGDASIWCLAKEMPFECNPMPARSECQWFSRKTPDFFGAELRRTKALREVGA